MGVECIAYNPTGREIVTGGYDKTIRIFDIQSSQCRELYSNRRMQKVHCLAYSADSRFIYSGSDDTNVRVWKTNASVRLDKLKPTEERKIKYYEKLKKRYEYMPEIKRITNHKHTPKWIHRREQQNRLSRASQIRKENNRRKHSKPGKYPKISQKQKPIVNK